MSSENTAIIPIVMPKWGLSMTEGTLNEWLVEVGDNIEVGQAIMDVETDKIASMVEAPDAGLLRRKVAEEGELYDVKALLGVLADDSVSEDEIDAYIELFESTVGDEEEEVEEALRSQYIELSTGTIRYVHRDGEGTPLLFIHGFGGDLDNWLFNLEVSANPVYALDLPGHGQSTKALNGDPIECLSQTISEFVSAKNISQCHLVGHSMGGLLAAKFAIENPSLAVSLTLLSPAGLTSKINEDYLVKFSEADYRKAMKITVSLLFADQSLVNRSMVDDLLKYKRLDGVEEALHTLRKAMSVNGQQTINLVEQLQNLVLPVTVIWGQQDQIVPLTPEVEDLSLGTQIRIELLPDVGHMPQMEAVDKVNEVLKQLS
ncbi:acetoin dehydrogenase E2 subunit dihydrolipoyllysine-residue acetyltransferase [Vibrio nigripulchritudo ATCC 27043]|uniref:acetoin dehydrogenase dihydrolipoyllysine-residue acetyltransferase subunit n=1 Tax=Vibrio nigripulchritudo TaxID=28173 RepID=UPI00021C3E87|nr:acetoin dehydrogenase dihydrolipoyllysine-residue acetyltransferase subunit [Vibrio nigripulchritudo]EGU59508.1 acetoin dehydrogenase E2 subunit dihydrolipoyllysine-residue acetyltransferase [Vibrio nigripulchritudo ATCC 27043]